MADSGKNGENKAPSDPSEKQNGASTDESYALPSLPAPPPDTPGVSPLALLAATCSKIGPAASVSSAPSTSASTAFSCAQGASSDVGDPPVKAAAPSGLVSAISLPMLGAAGGLQMLSTTPGGMPTHVVVPLTFPAASSIISAVGQPPVIANHPSSLPVYAADGSVTNPSTSSLVSPLAPSLASTSYPVTPSIFSSPERQRLSEILNESSILLTTSMSEAAQSKSRIAPSASSHVPPSSKVSSCIIPNAHRQLIVLPSSAKLQERLTKEIPQQQQKHLGIPSAKNKATAVKPIRPKLAVNKVI